MKELKYRTPKIEEFINGFEYQLRNGSIWYDCICDGINIPVGHKTFEDYIRIEIK